MRPAPEEIPKSDVHVAHNPRPVEEIPEKIVILAHKLNFAMLFDGKGLLTYSGEKVTLGHPNWRDYVGQAPQTDEVKKKRLDSQTTVVDGEAEDRCVR